MEQFFFTLGCSLYSLQGWKTCIFGYYPRPKDTNKLCGSICKESDTRWGVEGMKIPWLSYFYIAAATAMHPNTIGKRCAKGDHWNMPCFWKNMYKVNGSFHNTRIVGRDSSNNVFAREIFSSIILWHHDAPINSPHTTIGYMWTHAY
jgi:hypothetical protein